mmetsp:Transcript_59708/g.71129  ORF Transcript_59708/g.71129 Transcript_59708/m.71129 type:complete len:196 (-) Transcript_59708:209-796(-)
MPPTMVPKQDHDNKCKNKKENKNDSKADKMEEDSERESEESDDDKDINLIMASGYDSDDNDSLNAFSSSSPPVNVSEFVKPKCYTPPSKGKKGGKIVKNPLASLIKSSHVRQSNDKKSQDAQEDDNNEDYILNVSFAGNESHESAVRIVLRQEKGGSLETYYNEEMAGRDPAAVYQSGEKWPDDFLFYYGYCTYN